MKTKNLINIILFLVVFSGCNNNKSENESEDLFSDENILSIINKEDIQPKSKYEIIIDQSCSFDKDILNSKVYSFASDVQADNALNRIMKLTGLPPNFEIKSASVPNACAVIKCDDNGNCKRMILYNQEFMENTKSETNTKFAELAILAHEIGHHLSGHTLTDKTSRHDSELEADKFAGFMLYKLGASIEEVKKSYATLPLEGSNTHPGRHARIAAVKSGWYDAKRNGEVQSSPKVKNNSNSSKISNPIRKQNQKPNISKESTPKKRTSDYLISKDSRVGKTVKIYSVYGDFEVMTYDLDLGPKGYNHQWAARKEAESLVGGWRLPTLRELRIIYKKKELIGGFNEGGGGYWAEEMFWCIRFNDGGENENGGSGFTRAVRSL